jgi:hypothetical protein
VLRRLGLPAFVVLATLLASSACDDGGSPKMIDWDLSRSHRPADVGWELTAGGASDGKVDAKELENVAAVRVALPEGRVFEAPENVRDVNIGREGDRLDEITFAYEPQTAEGAYERATRLVKEWGLDGRKIEEWYAKAKGKTGSDAAAVETSGVFAEAPGPGPDAGRIGPDGPAVSVGIVYSFEDERPFSVHFELFWAR